MPSKSTESRARVWARPSHPEGTAGEGTPGSASSCCGESVKRYFKEVAQEWDSLRQSYFTEELRDAAMARADLTPDSVVVDAGTGTGFRLAGLAPRVRRAYGFDNSSKCWM